MLEYFFALFDKNHDHLVSKKEWNDFYDDLSAQVSSDEVFCSFLNKTWGISENDGTEVPESYVKGIVERLREKLYNKTDGVKEEFVLRKIYQDFDIEKAHNKPRCFNLNQMRDMLIKLGIPLSHKYLTAVFNYFDKARMGFIEYDYFEKFIIFDPYK